MSNLLLPPQETLFLNGKAIRSQPASVVLQQLHILPISFDLASDLTVEKVLKLACLSRKNTRYHVEKALKFTGISNFQGELVDNLSKYQQQKFFLSLALVRNVNFLLLDAFLNNLDIRYKLELLELLKKMLIEKGMTIVISLKDINLAARYSSRVALLYQGNIIDLGSPEKVMTSRNLANVFGVEFAVITTPFGLQFCPLAMYN